MKILCIADLHGDLNINKIKEIIKNYEISHIFILGDLARYGSINKEEGIDKFFNELKELNQEIYAIPGNCDSRKILEIFEKYNANYHNKICEIKNRFFIFFGGSNITPFNTTWEYEEEEIYKNLENLFNLCKNYEKDKILITHCPPYNTRCDIVGIKHIGSKGIREIIEKFQPKLNLCSHVHECYGKEDFIGKTRIVNIGEFKRNYVILDENLELIK